MQDVYSVCVLEKQIHNHAKYTSADQIKFHLTQLNKGKSRLSSLLGQGFPRKTKPNKKLDIDVSPPASAQYHHIDWLRGKTY